MRGAPFAFFAALLASLIAFTALAAPCRAGVEVDDPGALLPRDVGVIVQPAAAVLPPAPADFEQIDDGWLKVEFPSSVRERIAPLTQVADEMRATLSADMGQPVLDHVLVRVARTPEQMAQLAPRNAPPPGYATGVAYAPIHLALLALQAPDTWEAPDVAEVLRHELSHLALAEAVAGHHTPRWFDEGLAIRESGEAWMKRAEALWGASLGNHLLPLADLDRGFPGDRYAVNVAYAESADFVRFLMRSSDRARFGSLVQRVRAGTPFDRALADAYGTDVRKLEYEWKEEVGRHFGIVPMLTGGGLLWAIIVVLAVAAWFKKRARARAKLAQWAREDAALDAAIAAADTAARSPAPGAEGSATTDDALPERNPQNPQAAVVEHEGRWYTLH
jgi:hypothetical protein